MTNQELACSLYEQYKKNKQPVPACVVLASQCPQTKFKKSDIKRIRNKYKC